MRKFSWLFLALVGLLLAACGSGEDDSASESETDGLAGQAPPAVSATATVTAEAPTGDLGDRLDEMTLDKDDAPRGLSYMGEMTFDFDFEMLGVEGLGSGKAFITMFAGAGQQEMAMSMVILPEDPTLIEQAQDQMDELSPEQMQEVFDMMGDFGGLEIQDVRQLDVSSLGEDAFGLAMTFEMPQLAADMQMVLFWRDSVMAMAMTMGMSGGVAPDAVSLAEAMDAKIKDVVLQ